MSSNKRQGPLTPVGNVLHSLFENSKSELSDQFLRWKLWQMWPQIVGPTLGKCSEPVAYQKGRLFIWVNHSARMQEMTFIVRDLRDKVNEFAGKKWVRSIKFTLDRREIPTSAEGQEDLRNALSKSLPSGGEEPPHDR